MNILVLNAGSSSQKIALFAVKEEGNTVTSPLWQATLEWKDDEGRGNLTVESSGQKEPYQEQFTESIGRRQAVIRVLQTLWSGKRAVLSGPEGIAAVGHRVVHGGRDYKETTRITPEVMAAIARLTPLAPAHNPAALEGIEAVMKLLGTEVPQFAAFDTAFHSTLPDAAAVYPGPYAWWEQGIRRYGFHGISHRYCSERANQMLGHSANTLRIITCHLGNGCSLAAIRNGQSIDTTMGFTPMEGLMMGTRSGSIDPGILLYLQREQGQTPEHLATVLNQESGLKGVSGVSGDMREIADAIAQGDERAHLAFDTFIHRLRWHIGAMLPALGGLDVLVFTAGIGEHSNAVRAAVCEGLGFLGIELDPVKNAAVTGGEGDISADNAPVRILVIATQEDASIARECSIFLS